MNYTDKINQMLEHSETADIPVCNILHDLGDDILQAGKYATGDKSRSLLHTIMSQYHQLISLVPYYHKFRLSLRNHNIPSYSDPTKYDIIDNNFEFRDIYSEIQNNISILNTNKMVSETQTNL